MLMHWYWFCKVTALHRRELRPQLFQCFFLIDFICYVTAFGEMLQIRSLTDYSAFNNDSQWGLLLGKCGYNCILGLLKIFLLSDATCGHYFHWFPSDLLSKKIIPSAKKFENH